MKKRKLLLMNLQVFATPLNATTSAAEGNNLSAEMKTYYSDYLIDLAGPRLVHDQFGRSTPFRKMEVKQSSFGNTRLLQRR